MELPQPKRDLLLQQLLLCLAFSIPWAKKAIPTLIVVLFAAALVHVIRRKAAYQPTSLLANLSLCSVFMLLVAGITYSEHPPNAWNELGIKLSLLVFPILSFMLPNLNKEMTNRVHTAFVTGCFFFMSITLVRAAFITLEHGDFYYLTYDRLSWYMHPTYAATYHALALFILTEMALQKRYILHRKSLHWTGALAVLLFIALLSSKAGYLSALVTIVFACVRSFKRAQKPMASIGVALGALVIFTLTIALLPTTAERIQQAVQDIRTTETATTGDNAEVAVAHSSSTQLRLVTWQAAWTLMRENAFGTGTGDTQSKLNTIYLQQGETYAAEHQLNAHNQFLQTGAELGWIAVLLLVACMVFCWQSARGEAAATLFFGLCALNFLFESFLEVQAGIVFFSFWVMVYSKHSTRRPTHEM